MEVGEGVVVDDGAVQGVALVLPLGGDGLDAVLGAGDEVLGEAVLLLFAGGELLGRAEGHDEFVYVAGVEDALVFALDLGLLVLAEAGGERPVDETLVQALAVHDGHVEAVLVHTVRVGPAGETHVLHVVQHVLVLVVGEELVVRQVTLLVALRVRGSHVDLDQETLAAVLLGDVTGFDVQFLLADGSDLEGLGVPRHHDARLGVVALQALVLVLLRVRLLLQQLQALHLLRVPRVGRVLQELVVALQEVELFLLKEVVVVVTTGQHDQ